MTTSTNPDDSEYLSQYLVDAAWVQAHRDDPNVVLVDIDGEAGYQRGHIPTAVMLPSNYERDPVCVHLPEPGDWRHNPGGCL